MDPLLIAVLLFLLAGVLATADLLVPSGGVLAVASLLSALASVFFAFRSGYTAGVMMLALILIAIPIFVFVALRVWPYTPVGRRIILKIPPVMQTKVDPEVERLQELIGQVGVTQIALMPSGFVRIDRRNYNAVCETGFIEAGQNVQVLSVQQRNLIVASTSLAPTQPPAAPELLAPAPPPVSNESLLDRPAEELGLDSLD